MTRIVRIGGHDHAAHGRKRVGAEEIGAKAANLARMAALGLPVPPAFVIPIDYCAALARGDSAAEDHFSTDLKHGIEFLERATGKRFGDRHNPLLVSVRSGAARSMPGMLDTVLNVGCTHAALRGLMRTTGNPRFAWDCRRRFLEGYGTSVLGADEAPFDAALARLIQEEGVTSDRMLDGEALERLTQCYTQLIDGDQPADDAMEQLSETASAVVRSWMSERACTYRRLERLEHLQGTAVTVQAMVFGNHGQVSGAGVAFSRDPSNGRAQPVVDVLFDAQGEDVVSGRRTPESEEAIMRTLPPVARQLREILSQLEREFGDAQDVEFTIDRGELWMLQTRAAKRTPLAALRIAVDLVHEGILAPAEALSRLADVNIESISLAEFIDQKNEVASGVAASSGVAVGRAAFDTASAQRLAQGGDPVILLRPDISTSDVAGFAVSAGIVTAIGGRTAHAALVARQMGKPCVVGCKALTIEPGSSRAQIGNAAIVRGDWISIDGNNGNIFLGQRDVAPAHPAAELAEVERWRAGARSLSAAG